MYTNKISLFLLLLLSLFVNISFTRTPYTPTAETVRIESINDDDNSVSIIFKGHSFTTDNDDPPIKVYIDRKICNLTYLTSSSMSCIINNYKTFVDDGNLMDVQTNFVTKLYNETFKITLLPGLSIRFDICFANCENNGFCNRNEKECQCAFGFHGKFCQFKQHYINSISSNTTIINVTPDPTTTTPPTPPTTPTTLTTITTVYNISLYGEFDLKINENNKPTVQIGAYECNIIYPFTEYNLNCSITSNSTGNILNGLNMIRVTQNYLNWEGVWIF